MPQYLRMGKGFISQVTVTEDMEDSISTFPKRMLPTTGGPL